MSKTFAKVIVRTVNDLANHYWLSEIVIWLWYKKYILKMHYSSHFLLLIIMAWVYVPQPQVLWVTLNVQLRHICQPQTWSHQDSQALGIFDRHLPFEAAPPGFQPGLVAWRNSLSSIPPTFPFTVCKPWPSARGMVLVALTAEYQECLKVCPFDVNY